jgi:early secretory antigenic target protein ESAT-6
VTAGDYTAASFGTMAEAEQAFLQIYNSLTNELADLQRQLESSLQAWSGSARAAYTQAKAQWDAAAEQMGQVLNQLGVVIGEANTTYQDTERQLTNLWGA